MSSVDPDAASRLLPARDEGVPGAQAPRPLPILAVLRAELLIDGEHVAGGRFIARTYDVHSLGVYARAGSWAAQLVRGEEVTA